MIKDILVHASEDSHNAQRLDVAIGLAQRHEARLTALYALHYPELPGFVAAQIGGDLIAQTRAQFYERARDVESAFNETVARHGVTAEWRRVEGEPIGLLATHGQYADLVVVSQPDEDVEAGEGALPDELVMACGRPVLVVPRIAPQATMGKTVMVAWNSSREATRAVHDALPILQKADTVIVQSVNPPDEDHIAGADIATHLAHHGLKVDVRRSLTPEIDVADELLNAVSDAGADLIVMGAYGHSRVRELVLGGVTRDLLRHMTVPIVMSH